MNGNLHSSFISLLIAFCCVLMVFLSEALNAQSHNWYSLEGEGSPAERHENALVHAGNQFILIGGRGMKPVDLYDTQNGEWSQGTQPPFEIHHIQAVELDGLVYIAGALSGGWPHETSLSHILIYDPLLDKWALGPEIPHDRRRGAAGVVVYNDKIYIVNGIIDGHSSGWVSWLDEFDPAANQWRVLPDAPRTRDHLHAAVIDDKLYVAGGRRSGYQGQGFQATVRETDVFDFSTEEWSTLPSPEGDIPTERAGTSAAVHKGNFLVIGGESGSRQTSHDEVEMLDPDTGNWSTLNHLIRGRHGTQAIYFDDIVVVGAGSGDRGGGPELTSFEIMATEENPEIPSHPLTESEITVSIDQHHFSGNRNGETIGITLQSRHGNKATLITYVQLDNTNDFSVELPVTVPFVLAPGGQKTIEVSRKDNASENSEGTLLIKELGGTEPLRVQLGVK